MLGVVQRTTAFRCRSISTWPTGSTHSRFLFRCGFLNTGYYGGQSSLCVHDAHHPMRGRMLPSLFSTSTLDYYRILGISEAATQDQIKEAYRKLAFRWHPDRHKGSDQKEAQKKFCEVAEAYSTLDNPEKRKTYDKSRQLKSSRDFPPHGDPALRTTKRYGTPNIHYDAPPFPGHTRIILDNVFTEPFRWRYPEGEEEDTPERFNSSFTFTPFDAFLDEIFEDMSYPKFSRASFNKHIITNVKSKVIVRNDRWIKQDITQKTNPLTNRKTETITETDLGPVILQYKPSENYTFSKASYEPTCSVNPSTRGHPKTTKSTLYAKPSPSFIGSSFDLCKALFDRTAGSSIHQFIHAFRTLFLSSPLQVIRRFTPGGVLSAVRHIAYRFTRFLLPHAVHSTIWSRAFH